MSERLFEVVRRIEAARRLVEKARAAMEIASPESAAGAYVEEVDVHGRPVRPGDIVRIRLYPKGSARGVVIVGRAKHPDGRHYLAVSVDGRLVGLTRPIRLNWP